ncbi:hypothetical protein DYH55_08675 [Methylovirgula sp. 4M-Z18]|nr:hypothetical protein DYH55_08675 [Methylovirgula sp. 4M-Z18]
MVDEKALIDRAAGENRLAQGCIDRPQTDIAPGHERGIVVGSYVVGRHDHMRLRSENAVQPVDFGIDLFAAQREGRRRVADEQNLARWPVQNRRRRRAARRIGVTLHPRTIDVRLEFARPAFIIGIDARIDENLVARRQSFDLKPISGLCRSRG